MWRFLKVYKRFFSQLCNAKAVGNYGMKWVRLADQPIDQPIIQSALQPGGHFESIEIEISVWMGGRGEPGGMEGESGGDAGGVGVCGGKVRLGDTFGA